MHTREGIEHTRAIFIDIWYHFPDLLLFGLKPQSTHSYLQSRVHNVEVQRGYGSWLRTFSSLASIVPEPSASKRSNASLISCFCSSVSSFFGAIKNWNEWFTMWVGCHDVHPPWNPTPQFYTPICLPGFFLAARDGGFLYAVCKQDKLSTNN